MSEELFPDLFAPSEVKLQTDDRRVNPCVTAYGADPGGHKCGECLHLYAHHCSKKYYKCGLRKFTHGPGSDHKFRWPACAKFAAKAAVNIHVINLGAPQS